LILAACEELLRCGAFPVAFMTPQGAEAAFFELARHHHLATLTAYQKARARCMDATIRILSETNTRELSNVDPRKQALYAKTMKPISSVLTSKPWVLTLQPTEAYARDAEMSLREYEDFFYGTIFADQRNPIAAWTALKRDQDRLMVRLRGADRVRIAGEGTDLSLSVKRRTFINSDGRHNMPSGEVFTGPVETSAEGTIQFDFPASHAGRSIEGIRLVFRRGVVVEATARKNAAYLKTMLDLDAGARRLGELGIGTNMRIDRFTGCTLLDEKIGGTVHLALGRSYAVTGGRNQSAIHWDMIKDLRRGGAVHVDGRVFLRDGRFV
jgi:aminopeptidase